MSNVKLVLDAAELEINSQSQDFDKISSDRRENDTFEFSTRDVAGTSIAGIGKSNCGC